MIYSLSGKLVGKKDNYVIVEVGGIGLKVFTSSNVAQSLPQISNSVKIFSYLYVRENALELYGFITEAELNLFEKLNSVSGIGPKSALNVLSVAKVDQLLAAINAGKIDLLTKASGIGRKTAERIILDLKGKLSSVGSEAVINQMESDNDIEEALVGLGYTRQQARQSIAKIDSQITNFEERLKAALKKAKS